MEEMIILGKILSSSFVLTKFAPISWIIDIIRGNIKNDYLMLFFNIITLALDCFSCASFWIGFIFFGFWYAISAYIISYFYNQLVAPFVDKIRLF